MPPAVIQRSLSLSLVVLIVSSHEILATQAEPGRPVAPSAGGGPRSVSLSVSVNWKQRVLSRGSVQRAARVHYA